eukprot:scaffold225_cov388-Prasinococcus_capsulatus_cf.AAC.35
MGRVISRYVTSTAAYASRRRSCHVRTCEDPGTELLQCSSFPGVCRAGARCHSRHPEVHAAEPAPPPPGRKTLTLPGTTGPPADHP